MSSIVALKQPLKLPPDLPDVLRDLADKVASGRVTEMVVAYVIDDNFEYLWPSSLVDSVTLTTLAQAVRRDARRGQGGSRGGCGAAERSRRVNNDDEPVTLAERYVSASHSSHLRLEPGRCDVDMLIAAGKVSSPLGALLWRLRAEFDAARATAPGGPAAMNLTERALVLLEMRSLHACKQQLWSSVLQLLESDETLLIGQGEAAELAGRVLDAWLDPTCPGCEGRGFNGARHRGDQRITCRGCRGTGKRRTNVVRSGMQRRLADRIDGIISGALVTTEVEMRAVLRDGT